MLVYSQEEIDYSSGQELRRNLDYHSIPSQELVMNLHYSSNQKDPLSSR